MSFPVLTISENEPDDDGPSGYPFQIGLWLNDSEVVSLEQWFPSEAAARAFGEYVSAVTGIRLEEPVTGLLEWRVAPAGNGYPAALIATREGLASVSVAMNPELVELSSGWHYLTGVARKMTEALS